MHNNDLVNALNLTHPVKLGGIDNVNLTCNYQSTYFQLAALGR